MHIISHDYYFYYIVCDLRNNDCWCKRIKCFVLSLLSTFVMIESINVLHALSIYSNKDIAVAAGLLIVVFAIKKIYTHTKGRVLFHNCRLQKQHGGKKWQTCMQHFCQLSRTRHL